MAPAHHQTTAFMGPLPYQGVPAGGRPRAATPSAAPSLVSLVDTYVRTMATTSATVRMGRWSTTRRSPRRDVVLLVRRHEGDASPFYYRVHSPVVLIEFDHHPGVVFDNLEPSRNHIHTVIRTPNGGDYGADLLRQHHERYDHSTGDHQPRERADHH